MCVAEKRLEDRVGMLLRVDLFIPQGAENNVLGAEVL